MARYVKVHNKKVIDAIEATSDSINNLIDTTPGEWIQTDNAGIGMNYDPVNEIFYNNQPFPSWVLDNNGSWNPPTPKPDNLDSTHWNEETKSWDVD